MENREEILEKIEQKYGKDSEQYKIISETETTAEFSFDEDGYLEIKFDESEINKEFEYIPKSDQEIKVIAMDIYNEKIFHSNLMKGADPSMSFGLLRLIGIDDIKALANSKITLIYEYMYKAGPLSVNGYPTFLSMKFLNKEDHKKVAKKLEEIHEAMSKI